MLKEELVAFAQEFAGLVLPGLLETLKAEVAAQVKAELEEVRKSLDNAAEEVERTAMLATAQAEERLSAAITKSTESYADKVTRLEELHVESKEKNLADDVGAVHAEVSELAAVVDQLRGTVDSTIRAVRESIPEIVSVKLSAHESRMNGTFGKIKRGLESTLRVTADAFEIHAAAQAKALADTEQRLAAATADVSGSAQSRVDELTATVVKLEAGSSTSIDELRANIATLKSIVQDRALEVGKRLDDADLRIDDVKATAQTAGNVVIELGESTGGLAVGLNARMKAAEDSVKALADAPPAEPLPAIDPTPLVEKAAEAIIAAVDDRFGKLAVEIDAHVKGIVAPEPLPAVDPGPLVRQMMLEVVRDFDERFGKQAVEIDAHVKGIVAPEPLPAIDPEPMVTQRAFEIGHALDARFDKLAAEIDAHVKGIVAPEPLPAIDPAPIVERAVEGILATVDDRFGKLAVEIDAHVKGIVAPEPLPAIDPAPMVERAAEGILATVDDRFGKLAVELDARIKGIVVPEPEPLPAIDPAPLVEKAVGDAMLLAVVGLDTRFGSLSDSLDERVKAIKLPDPLPAAEPLPAIDPAPLVDARMKEVDVYVEEQLGAAEVRLSAKIRGLVESIELPQPAEPIDPTPAIVEKAAALAQSLNSQIDEMRGSLRVELDAAVRGAVASIVLPDPLPPTPPEIIDPRPAIEAAAGELRALVDASLAEYRESAQQSLDLAVASLPIPVDGKVIVPTPTEYVEGDSYKQHELVFTKAGGLYAARVNTKAAPSHDSVEWACIVSGMEMAFEQDKDDPRVIKAITRKADGVESVQEFYIPMVIYRGVYRVGERYRAADQVTHDGSQWIALKDGALDKPAGGTGEWKLAAKAGKDGKVVPGEERRLWRGEYKENTLYLPNDIMRYNGKKFQAKRSTRYAPSSTSSDDDNWLLYGV